MVTEGWVAPESLLVPTVSVAVNLGVQVIGSNIVGNDIIEAVAEFIGAKARLELWIGHLDTPLTLQEQFALGDVVDAAVRILYEAWVVYEEAHRAAGGKASGSKVQRQALLMSAREATAILVNARNADSA